MTVVISGRVGVIAAGYCVQEDFDVRQTITAALGNGPCDMDGGGKVMSMVVSPLADTFILLAATSEYVKPEVL